LRIVGWGVKPLRFIYGKYDYAIGGHIPQPWSVSNGEPEVNGTAPAHKVKTSGFS